MHRNLREKHAALANLLGESLVHDNARQRTSHRTVQKLDELSYETACSSFLVRPVSNSLSLLQAREQLLAGENLQ
jgi:hypothetical protein